MTLVDACFPRGTGIDTLFSSWLPSASLVRCMLSRAVRSFTSARPHLQQGRIQQGLAAHRCVSSNAATTQAIRDGFIEVRSALALVNQGERLSEAQKQVAELARELDVSHWLSELLFRLKCRRIQTCGLPTMQLLRASSSSSRIFRSRQIR